MHTCTHAHMQLQVTSPLLTFSLFPTVDPPKITRHTERQSVATGTSIAFTVEATGDDLQFLWHKDGKDIDTNESRLQYSWTDNASTLRIQHVKKSDRGLYKCLVRNRVEETSYEAELIVCELFFLVAGLFFLFLVFGIFGIGMCVVLTVEFSFHFGVGTQYSVYTTSAVCP